VFFDTGFHRTLATVRVEEIARVVRHVGMVDGSAKWNRREKNRRLSDMLPETKHSECGFTENRSRRGRRRGH
jgi:hypothetical protein